MNRLKGKISAINHAQDITSITIECGTHLLHSIIIDENEGGLYAINDLIDVLFKETEVSLSINEPKGLSIQNQIKIKVNSINKGEILSELTLINTEFEIQSIISSNSLSRLNIKVDNEIYALIKTNEIMLSK